MTFTECCECDRTASVFHGRYAYCSRCLDDAIAAEPEAHQCPQCRKDQPRTTLWERRAPCGACQGKRR